MNKQIIGILSSEILFFALTFFFGILAGRSLLHFAQINKIAIPRVDPINFLISFFIFVLLIFLFLSIPRVKKSKKITLKLLFIFASFYGSLLSLSSIFRGDISFVVAFLLILAWLLLSNVLVHNLVMVLSLAGIGAGVGIGLEPKGAVLLLALLSIYDVIAVYKTKHMVKMARSMIENKVIMGFIMPLRFKDLFAPLKEVSTGTRFIILGGGDVGLPLMLAVSVLRNGLIGGIIIAIASICGLFVSFYLFITQKERKPMPALPPIALFAIIGYLISTLIPQ